MKELKQHIPNCITSINIVCGCIAIPFALERNWEIVMILTFIALIADFLDGFIARLLNVTSKIGGELDSLADVVTFGVLPGMIMFRIMSDLACKGECTGLLSSSVYPYIAFIIPAVSAIRLAKFNVDTTQTYHFKGLPTPANAMFFLSMPYFLEQYPLNPRMVMVLVVFFSMMLVSDMRLIAFKFKSKSVKDNLEKIALVVLSIPLIIYFKQSSFVYVIALYLFISILHFTFIDKKVKQSE